MADTVIGALKLRVTADATGLRSGLESATQAVQSYNTVVMAGDKPMNTLEAHFRVLPKRIAENIESFKGATQKVLGNGVAMGAIHSAGMAARTGFLLAASGAKALWVAIAPIAPILLAVAAALAAVVGIAWAVKSSLNASAEAMQRMDSALDLAEQIGIATNSLIEFRYSCLMLGGSAELMDKSLQQMQKNIGDAAMGTGRAIIAFKRLGLSAAELQKMDTEAQFRAIAKAFAQVTDPAERAALAAKIFSRNNMRILLTLDAVGKGADDAKKKLQYYNATVSQEDVSRAAQYNDAVDTIKVAGEGFKNQLSRMFGGAQVELAKMTASLIAFVTKVMKAAWACSTLKMVFKLMEMQAKLLNGVLELLNTAIDKASELIEKAQSKFASFVSLLGFKELSKKIEPKISTEAIDEANAKVQDTIDKIRESTEKMRLGEIGFQVKQFRDSGASEEKIKEYVAAQTYMAQMEAAQKRITEEKQKQKSIDDSYLKDMESIQDKINKIVLGEREMLRIQLERKGYSAERIENLMREQDTLTKLEEASKAAKEAEKEKVELQKKAVALRKEEIAAAKRTYESTLTAYEKSMLRQREYLEQFARGDISSTTAGRAMKSEQESLRDQARQKAQGAESTTTAYTKGSSGAYNAIANALGQKDKQAEIAKNTEGLLQEWRSEASPMRQIVTILNGYKLTSESLDASVVDI